jgi:hypothetical protein
MEAASATDPKAIAATATDTPRIPTFLIMVFNSNSTNLK